MFSRGIVFFFSLLIDWCFHDEYFNAYNFFASFFLTFRLMVDWLVFDVEWLMLDTQGWTVRVLQD